MPADGDLLRTRLAYAFRPPVALGRMDFNGKTVKVEVLQLRDGSIEIQHEKKTVAKGGMFFHVSEQHFAQ